MVLTPQTNGLRTNGIGKNMNASIKLTKYSFGKLVLIHEIRAKIYSL